MKNMYCVSFEDIVKDGDLAAIRSKIQDSISLDPTLKVFNERLAYAEGKIKDLYEKHDGKAFNTDKASWNMDYLSKQATDVLMNFSKERVEHIKDVAAHINNPVEDADESKLPLILMGAGGAGLIAGLVASKAVVAVAGGAVAAAGVFLKEK